MLSKKKIRTIIIVSGILLLLCYRACNSLNYSEDNMVGNYKVCDYKLNDSTAPYDLPTLSLYSNKRFLLKYKNKKIEGTWYGDTYDDLTGFTLTADKDPNHRYKHIEEATGRDFIYFEMDANDYYFPLFYDISFKQTDKINRDK